MCRGARGEAQRVARDAKVAVLEDIAGKQRDEGLIDRDHGGAAIALGKRGIALLKKGPAGAGCECRAAIYARAAVGGDERAREVEELHLDVRVAESEVLDPNPRVFLAKIERIGFAARCVGERGQRERRGKQRE